MTYEVSYKSWNLNMFIKSSFERITKIGPILLALIFFSSASVILYLTWVGIQEDKSASIVSISNNLQQTIIQRLKGDRDYLKLLGEMRKRNELTTENFEQRALPYLKSHPDLINFTWVDAQSYIRSTAPLKGNEQIIGLHLDLPEPARASKKARETRESVYTDAFEALQGKSSFEVWVPIFDGKKFIGLFAGVYSIERLLDQVIPEGITDSYSIEIMNVEGAILTEKNNRKRKITEQTIIRDLGVNNIRILISRYQEGIFDTNVAILILLIGVSGLLVIASIVALQSQINKRKIAQEKLEGLNNELTHEVNIRKEIEQGLVDTTIKLKRTNQELEQFVYAASHDLKAPLRAIYQLANWIEEDLDQTKNEDTIRYIKQMKSRSERMQALLDSLLNFSKLGTEDLKEQIFNPRDSIDHAVYLLSPPGTINISIPDIMPDINGSKTLFEQIVMNLIGNSIKHLGSDRGTIEIAVAKKGDRHQFSVKDTGPGIESRHQQQIFEMFKTLRPRDEVEGSGMGLAIVKKAISLHGGEINVISNPRERRGATFIFCW